MGNQEHGRKVEKNISMKVKTPVLSSCCTENFSEEPGNQPVSGSV